ncbi:hypothetical protein D9757_004485 [Collybiopsis confluens]|uniref:Uncharacterized protein n=1 Tax=Collybiopsis confluens TaxID=2823264 RepID=A0A8H5HWJ3_9AGAR|nr:hypothetical protein D9757_004485 [Collybiopsis confluens]
MLNRQMQNFQDIQSFFPDVGVGLQDTQYLSDQLDIGEQKMLEWLNKDIQILHPQSDVVLSLGASCLFCIKFPLRLTPFGFPQYILQIFRNRDILEAIYGEDAPLLFYSVRNIYQLIPVALAHNLSNSAFRTHFFNSISTPLAAALETAFQTNTSTSSFTQTAEDTSRVDEAGQKLRKSEIEEVDRKLATGEHKRARIFPDGSGRSSISFPPLLSPKHLPLQTIEDTTVPASSLHVTPTKPQLDSLLLSSSPLASSSPILPLVENDFSQNLRRSNLLLLSLVLSIGTLRAFFIPFGLGRIIPRILPAIPQSTSGHPDPYNSAYNPSPQSVQACLHSDQRASSAPSFHFATPISQVGTTDAVSSLILNPSSLAASNPALSVNPTLPPTLPIGPQPAIETLTKVEESSSELHSIHEKPGQPAQHLLEQTKSLPLPLPLPPTPGHRALRHVQPFPKPPQSTPPPKKPLPLPPLPPHPRSAPGPQVTLEPKSINAGDTETEVDSAPTPLSAPSAFDLLPPGSESFKLPSLPKQEACSPPPPPLSSKSTQSNLDPEYFQQTPLHAYPPPGITHCPQSQLPLPQNRRERSDPPIPIVQMGFVPKANVSQILREHEEIKVDIIDTPKSEFGYSYINSTQIANFSWCIADRTFVRVFQRSSDTRRTKQVSTASRANRSTFSLLAHWALEVAVIAVPCFPRVIVIGTSFVGQSLGGDTIWVRFSTTFVLPVIVGVVFGTLAVGWIIIFIVRVVIGETMDPIEVVFEPFGGFKMSSAFFAVVVANRDDKLLALISGKPREPLPCEEYAG